MALIVTYDTVQDLQIRIARTNGVDAEMGVAYSITSAGSFPIQRAKADVPLNATQQAQLNALHTAVLNFIKNFEGIV